MTWGMLLICAIFILRTQHAASYPLSIGASYAPFDIVFTPPPYTAEKVAEDSVRLLKNPFDHIFRYFNQDYNFTTNAPGANVRNITRSTSETGTSLYGTLFNGTSANLGTLSTTPTNPLDMHGHSQNGTSAAATERDLKKENWERCEKLASDHLREACRSIVEETLANTDYAYVLVDDNDLDGLKKELTDLGQRRALGVSPMLPGIQGDYEPPCPSRSKWNDGTWNNQRSLSPWTSRQQYDPDRIPQYMNVARCLCAGCIDPSMKGETVENRNLISEEITRSMRVIRKDKTLKDFSECPGSKSKACYESMEEVAVGCHCRAPTIRPIS